MKLVQFLLVILTAEIGFLQATGEGAGSCYDKCSEEERNEMVCLFSMDPDSPLDRCYFKCRNKVNPKKEKEVSCPPGSISHCINTECTPEEKRTKFEGTKCHFLPNDSICENKCFNKVRPSCTIEEK